MAENPSPEERVVIDDLTPEEANRIIHSHRKVRYASIDEPEAAADRYLGQNSIPALLREQSSPVHKGDGLDIRQDMRSILGLDTSAPFPLMSAQHLQKLTQDISNELPSDREVMK
ncbi:hypothetical protein ACHAPQ_003195 [Fusarium lateritium]